MNEINKIPSGQFWSLASVGGELKAFNSPQRVLEIRRDSARDLITGEVYLKTGIEILNDLLSRKITSFRDEGRVLFHAFFELGHIWLGTNSLSPDTLLGYWLEFSEEMPFSFSPSEEKVQIEWKLPNFDDYKLAFDRGVEHLYQGDCYQFNLTFPIEGKWNSFDLNAFASSFLANSYTRGEYASLTKIGDHVFYSNSPECLGNLCEENGVLFLESRPIKGTVSTQERSNEDAWKILESSEKDESELFMITDLLRNDLNKIGAHWVEVLEKKAPLLVHHLIHSYSHLRVEIDPSLSLLEIFKPLFPGGSITGVPKKRVMEILRKIEGIDRGFYCGSTLLLGKGDFKTSINIRSGIIDLKAKKIAYHSGGGITVKSNSQAEFREFLDKFQSFNRLINEKSWVN